MEGAQLREAAARWKQESVARYEIFEDGQRVYDAWIFSSNDGSFFGAGQKELAPFELANGVVQARSEGTEVERRDALQQGYDGILALRENA